MNDFTTSLNNFQAAQRKAAEKEKESLARARAHSGSAYVSSFSCPVLSWDYFCTFVLIMLKSSAVENL